MGTFAETANGDYRSLFTRQGKITSVFRLQKTNGSLPLLFSVCSKQMEVAFFCWFRFPHINIYILNIYK
jgi:hypothetical protein